jgi:hypothetical protein
MTATKARSRERHEMGSTKARNKSENTKGILNEIFFVLLLSFAFS